MHPRLQPTWPQQLLSSVLAFLMALPGNVAVAGIAITAGPVERPANDPDPAAHTPSPTSGSDRSGQPQSFPAPPPALSATPTTLRVATSPGLALQLLSAAGLGLVADIPTGAGGTPEANRTTPPARNRGVALASPETGTDVESSAAIRIIEVAFELVSDTQTALSIRYEVLPGYQYVVEYRDEFGVPDFCEPWTQLPNAPHNTGEILDLEVQPSRFYRVRALEAPSHGLFALLAHDTGARGDDGITSDPAITGEVTLTGPGRKLMASLDVAGLGWVPVLETIESPQHFDLSAAEVLQLAGGTLADGPQDLSLAVLEADGQVLVTHTVSFVLDRTPPALRVGLDPASDSLPMGDHATQQHWIALRGETEPDALVTLEPNGLWTHADAAGAFGFDLLPLELGGNQFVLRAFDQACVEGVSEYAVTRTEFDLSSPFDDALTGWDQRLATPRFGNPGAITVQDGKVTLVEGDSFEVALERDLSIPAGAGMLYLSYAAPSFDSTARNRMNDAFEVALVAADGRPLTYTIQAAAGILPASVPRPQVLPASATVFYNHSQGQTPFAAPGVEVLARNLGGFTLRADIRHLPAGSQARLILRLVNNDRDLASSVQILDLKFVPDLAPLNFPGSPPPAFSVAERGSAGPGSSPTGSHPGCEPARNLGTALTGPKIVDGLAPRSPGAPASPTLAIAAPTDQATLLPQPVLITGYAVAGRTLDADPPGSGDPEIIFAEDVSPWPPEVNHVPRLNPINSRQAMASFATRLRDVRTEDFESYPVGSSPSTLMFGSTSAGLLGERMVYEVLDPTSTRDGDFPSSGTRYILLYPGDRPAAGSVFFRLEFSSPQSAFGFFGTDFEANRFELVLTGADEAVRTVSVPVTLPQSSGGACFLGIIDTRQPFHSIEFRNIGTVADGFGFDDLTIATPEQVLPKPIANRIVLVTVNGVPVDALDQAGNFFAAVQVLPGRNRFEVVATDAYELTTTNTFEVLGVSCVEDRASLSEVSASIEQEYARTTFNEWTHTLYADVAIRNVGTHPIQAPLLVGVTGISEPSVSLLGADGVSVEGIPYYDFSATLNPHLSTLNPQTTTGPRSLAFHNPNRVQFTYELVILGGLNRAPAFTTVPRLEAIVGQPYTYDADASDPDGDRLTYLTSMAPAGMAVDPVSGMVTWAAGGEVGQDERNALGLHEVILVADDGRGGAAEQRFMLSVIEPPANRPPFFTSRPVVHATVNGPYSYDAEATDPDQDPLTYSLLEGPAGMTANAETGAIYWTPTVLDLNGTEDGSDSDPTLPSVVPGLRIERYAALPEPAEMSFAPDGTLFVGRNDVLPEGRELLRIRMISDRGSVIQNYGPARLDPDAVLYDADGTISGVPGAVLVGGFEAAARTGSILRVLPDQTSSYFLAPSLMVGNVTGLIRDSTGRLLFVNYPRGGVIAVEASTARVLVDGGLLGTDLGEIVVANDGRILLAGLDGIIRVFDPAGHLLDPDFAALGDGGFPTLAFGPGGYWDANLYAVDGLNGALLEILPDGSKRILGTGFGRPFDMQFGADGALYISDYERDQILRVSPDRATRGLEQGEHPVALTVSDGRGGFASQRFVVRLRTDPDNHDPVIVSEPITKVGPGQGYQYPLEALDADGDALSYTLVEGPEEMEVDPTTGVLTWQSPSTAPSEHPVRVRVSDGQGGVDEQAYTLNVLPLPDLVVSQIDKSGLSYDFQCLTVRGTISATVSNLGPGRVEAPFKVLFFEDRNLNGGYELGIDAELATATVHGSLLPGSSTPVAVAVASEVLFPENVAWAYVDSRREIQEAREDNNFRPTGVDCLTLPQVGGFNPVVEWNKRTFTVLPQYNQVMMAPAAIDLSGDGIPDIVFSTFTGGSYTSNGRLRAISGDHGAELWTVTDTRYAVDPGSDVAVGDIDGDTRPEILTLDQSGAVIAFEHDGAFTA